MTVRALMSACLGICRKKTKLMAEEFNTQLLGPTVIFVAES